MKEKRIEAFSYNENHGLLLDNQGKLYSWGRNIFGQLGDGTRTDSLDNLKEVKTGELFKKIATGWITSYGISRSGEVFGWGEGTDGSLGPEWYMRKIPTSISGLPFCRDLSAGDSHVLALDLYKRVWAWGTNDCHQVCSSNEENVSRPEVVDFNSEIVQVAAGLKGSLALNSEGKVFVWGKTLYSGILGYSREAKYPEQISLPKIKKIGVVDGLDIFLTVSGEIFLMGRWEVGFYNVNGNEKREEIYEPKLLKNLSGVEDFIQSKEFLIFKCENGLKIWLSCCLCGSFSSWQGWTKAAERRSRRSL